MDVDPMEYVGDDDEKEEAKEAAEKEKHKSRLNAWVAITVAIIAGFMAVCNVKDGNIVQAMQQAQADQIDNWAWYQARNIRAETAQATADQMRLQALSAPAAAKAEYDKQIAAYQKLAQEQSAKKEDTRKAAEAAKKAYDDWNIHDDQFDLSEALLSLSIALLATTSLTQKRWLYFVALVPTVFGMMFGLAGLMGWGLHSNWFAKVLGT